MLAALRYRRAQTIVVVVLAALVTTCLVLAPLYTRALEQAMIRTMLREATVAQTGLRLGSTSPTAPQDALDPDALEQLLPESLRTFVGSPIPSTGVDVRKLPFAAQPGGRLLNRAGMCEHVTITDGHVRRRAARSPCRPTRSRPTDAGRVHHRGGGVRRRGQLPRGGAAHDAPGRRGLRAGRRPVLVRRPPDRLGRTEARLRHHAHPAPDTDRPGDLAEGNPAPWFQPVYGLDFPLLADRVGIDQIGTIGVDHHRARPVPHGGRAGRHHASETITVRSGLPAIADEARVGSEQASITVPLLMAQMALLLVCVLWLSSSRPPTSGAARSPSPASVAAGRAALAGCSSETLPPVVLGAPLGALLAVGLSTVARNTVLTSDPPFEVPAAAAVALVAGLLLMVGLTVLSVRRVCRDPVADLIRSVPPRRTGVRLGVLEAMLVAAAAAAFIALVTGSVQGPVGQLAPALLALAVGVVAARLLSSVLAVGGRWLLQRGRPTAGAAALTSSRRGTTRWLVPWSPSPSASPWSRPMRSPSARATGPDGRPRRWGRPPSSHWAPATSPWWPRRPGRRPGRRPRHACGCRRTERAGDHDSRRGPERLPPDRLVAGSGRRLAGLGPARRRRPCRRWSSAVPDVTYHVDAPAFDVVTPAVRPAPTSLALAVRAVRADGSVDTIPMGVLPDKGVVGDQEATVACADGCRITGIGVQAPASTAAVTGSVTVSRLAVDGLPVELGSRDLA